MAQWTLIDNFTDLEVKLRDIFNNPTLDIFNTDFKIENLKDNGLIRTITLESGETNRLNVFGNNTPLVWNFIRFIDSDNISLHSLNSQITNAQLSLDNDGILRFLPFENTTKDRTSFSIRIYDDGTFWLATKEDAQLFVTSHNEVLTNDFGLNQYIENSTYRFVGNLPFQDGTEAFPWLIFDATTFARMNVNSNDFFIVIEDFTIGDGLLVTSSNFTGDLDGQNFTITMPNVIGGSFKSSVFGTIASNGFVKNLNIISLDVTGTSVVGGFVSNNQGGTINNCKITINNVNGNNQTGGFTGQNSGIITNCQVIVKNNVTGTDLVGGFVGSNVGGTIENCTVNVTNSVTGSVDDVGGFAGRNILSGTIETSNVFINTITGTTNIGGFVGDNDGTIQVCTCSITNLIGSGFNIGGFGGLNDGTIQNCKTTIVSSITGGSTVGGFVGRVTGLIQLSTSVIFGGTSLMANGDIGGFVGTGSGATITECKTIMEDLFTNFSSSAILGGFIGEATNTVLTDNYCKTDDITLMGANKDGGGLAGEVKGSSFIQNNYVSGDFLDLRNGFFKGDICGELTGGTINANFVNFVTINPSSMDLIGSQTGGTATNNSDSKPTDAQLFIDGWDTNIWQLNGDLINPTLKNNPE